MPIKAPVAGISCGLIQDDDGSFQTFIDIQGVEDFHDYHVPPSSVGEARAPRSPNRREYGHGALAERALVPVLPSVDEFPYAIRVVSEVLSSNGSTSQGSICGSTLALMDAGVPIKAPVAGISCGLIQDDDGSFQTFIDIQGVEDFHGEMDFKVAGTKAGITAPSSTSRVWRTSTARWTSRSPAPRPASPPSRWT